MGSDSTLSPSSWSSGSWLSGSWLWLLALGSGFWLWLWLFGSWSWLWLWLFGYGFDSLALSSGFFLSASACLCESLDLQANRTTFSNNMLLSIELFGFSLVLRVTPKTLCMPISCSLFAQPALSLSAHQLSSLCLLWCELLALQLPQSFSLCIIILFRLCDYLSFIMHMCDGGF